MKIRQHIPSCCSGVTPNEAEFTTVEELLEIDWVKLAKEDKDFYRFSFSFRDEPDIFSALMLELNEGKFWWVIGYVPFENAKQLKDKLPNWTPTYSKSTSDTGNTK